MDSQRNFKATFVHIFAVERHQNTFSTSFLRGKGFRGPQHSILLVFFRLDGWPGHQHLSHTIQLSLWASEATEDDLEPRDLDLEKFRLRASRNLAQYHPCASSSDFLRLTSFRRSYSSTDLERLSEKLCLVTFSEFVDDLWRAHLPI